MLPHEDYYNAFRGRYFQRFSQHMGAIPDLPQYYGNANDRYQLLAWLHRAFKHLLDDFIQLEQEFEEFKDKILELLEILIPQLIREFIHSKEFYDRVTEIIREWYERELKPIIDQIQNDIKNIYNAIDNLNNEINNIKKDINNINNRIEKLEQNNEKLDKIIEKLKEIGVWENDGFKDGYGIAGGNINLFSGKEDGSHWIRTNNGKTENDLVGGV